jgi:hypothetical protein
VSGSPFPLDEHITVGSSVEATAWVRDSSLGPECKEAMLGLIARFPTQTFTREDDALLDHFESIDDVELPGWLRRIRTTLSGFGSAVALRFDGIGPESPRSDQVGDIWYVWQLAAWDEEMRGILRDDMRVYPVADWRETLRSCLAIDLANPEDERIFEYSYLSVVDNWSLDEPLRDAMYPAFRSYCAMISHIVAVQTTDGAVVDAEKA